VIRRRLPWLLWAGAMVLFVVTGSLGVVNGSFAADPFFLGVALIMIVGYTTMGALIASRTSGNAIGWLLMMVGLAFLLGGLSDEYLTYAVGHGPEDLPLTTFMGWLSNWIFLSVLFPVPLVLLLFPDGTLPSRRWRPVAAAIAVLWVLVPVALILNPGPIDVDQPFDPPLANPTGIPAIADVTGVIISAGTFALIGLAFLAVGGLVRRYRRSEGDERQQMRWFVAAVTLAAPLLLAGIIAALLGTDDSDLITGIIFFSFLTVLGIGFPAACAVAILRYRLYDLDLVIKKTVLYAIVAMLLVGISVAVLSVVGGTLIEADPVTIMASVALGVAVWPAVRVARRLADRVVYGRRATPYEVLTDFSHRVGGSYAAEDVLPRMARILGDAIGATGAVVWLRVGPELRPAGRSPADGPAPEPVPIHGDALPDLPGDAAIEVRDQGALLGAITVSMPANDPMNPSKGRLVRDLASQAGLVLRNVRLIEELRASRQRLVATQDEERRKLERNIHDGAQQQLVALTVKLRLLEQIAERDPVKASEMAGQIQADATSALDDLRDLARGIYPPLLADKGLPVALEAQARKAAVRVAVDAGDLGRFSQDVEAAVYFSCLEALQNVAKYAEASAVRISLARHDGRLSFAVTDDGVGFDPAAATHGSGLQGIADRLDALGGTFEVESRVGSGTVVKGTVPVA